MMIIDPVTLGDVTFSRLSSKNVWDKTGTLVTVPADAMAITYDPKDLTKAPYPLIEGAATNALKSSASFKDPVWTKRGACTVTPRQAAAPDGTVTMDLIAGLGAIGTADFYQYVAANTFTNGARIEPSIFVRKVSAAGTFAIGHANGGAWGFWSVDLSKLGTGVERITRVHPAVTITNEFMSAGGGNDGIQMYCNSGTISLYLWGAQFEAGTTSTSYIPTPPTFVSRASTATYYDAAGALQTAAANVARMTYDPANLSSSPYLVVEGAATNLLTNSEVMGVWSSGVQTQDAATAPNGTLTADLIAGIAPSNAYRSVAVSASTTYTTSIFVKAQNSSVVVFGFESLGMGVDARFTFDLLAGIVTGAIGGGGSATIRAAGGGWWRLAVTATTIAGATGATLHFGSTGAYVWGAQLETGSAATSYIPSSVGTRAADVVSYSQTRAADIVGPGAGLIYSNVAIGEPAYSAATSYAQGAVVYDPATHLTYTSMVAANAGNALANNPTKWQPGDVTNRWKLLDQYNNTQTANPEEILIVASPQAICQGIYLGNVDATEIRLSVVDLAEGLVYSETRSLVISDSGSSFYNWGFKKIRRKSYLVSVQLPPYANALVTIAIKKPGGTAKCGMCVIGTLVDVGLSQYGLGREIKDYSTINFNFDGTSNQQVRNFAKRMDADVVIDNDKIDGVIETLEAYRQKPVAWIGVKEFGSACLFGRYSAFKNVIENFPQSKMNLQIEGTV